MTVTAVPSVPAVPERLDDAEYQARVERLRGYREQLDRADQQADTGSLDRAADLAAIYADKRWVDEQPAPKKTHHRGRPVEPDSLSRFAKWAKERLELEPRHCYQLYRADQIAAYLRQAQIKPGASERVLRPLSKLLKKGSERGEQAPDIWRRAVQLAEGDRPTNTHIRKALADHDKELGYTQPRVRTDDGQSFTSVSKRFLRDGEWIARHATEAQRQKVIAELQARLTQLQQPK
jgi:hypothetical protein